jgi:hypothetical protein
MPEIFYAVACYKNNLFLLRLNRDIKTKIPADMTYLKVSDISIL